MKALMYVWTHTMRNHVKTLFKKPAGILYLLVILGYGSMIVGAFTSKDLKGMAIFQEKSNFVLLLALGILLFEIPSMLSYAKRKGVVFQVSDVHFLFPAPISPKLILVFSMMKTYFFVILINIVMTVTGIFFFHLPVGTVLLYSIVSLIIGICYDYGELILLYGNEKKTKAFTRIFQIVLYGIIGVFALVLIYLYLKLDYGFAIFKVFAESPFLQMVPVVGWHIALIELIFMGPTTVNVICSILYVVTGLILIISAVRMKCTGEYYEEAMEFADTYKKLKDKNKKGEATNPFSFSNKKKKYKTATVTYKGAYAKAIFYRQLLEYKKERFFIFDGMSLAVTIVSVAMSYLSVTQFITLEGDLSIFKYFMIPGVCMYFIFIVSAMSGKWTKELENPYTYLIPDKPVRKLWYATIIEHIRSFIHGMILVIPASIIMGMPIIYMILVVLMFVCLMAGKLYMEVLATGLFGNLLGNTGRQLIRMFGMMIIIGGGIAAALLFGIISKSIMTGLVAMTIAMFILVGVLAIFASISFTKMDVADA